MNNKINNFFENNLDTININCNNKRNIIYDNNNYKLYGIIINDMYNKQYLLYEYNITCNNNIYNNESTYSVHICDNNIYNKKYLNETDIIQANDNNKYLYNNLYKYIVINDSNIIYTFGPRDKINNKDYIYITKGINIIGPFRFIKILTI
jgi:hypothetical protein